MAKLKKTKTKTKTNSKDKSKPKTKSKTKVRVLKPEVIPRSEETDSDAIQPEVIEPELINVDNLEELEPAATKALSPTDPVARYMAEVKRYRLLTREEERKLALQYYETKDPSAAEKLVTANLRFVVKIAMEYAKFGAKLIDLIQEGNVGLMHAVREYNPYKDVRLITYAVWWIRGYIQEYLMKQYSMVKIGTTQNQRKLFYRLQKEKEMIDRLGMKQAVALLSGQMGIPQDEVSDMSQRLSGRDVSLNQPVDDGDRTTLMDFQSRTDLQSADELLSHNEQISKLKDQIEKIRPVLSERELYLLDKRILADEPLTLQEVGDHYKITREAVRQMENRLIQKIKNGLEL